MRRDRPRGGRKRPFEAEGPRDPADRPVVDGHDRPSHVLARRKPLDGQPGLGHAATGIDLLQPALLLLDRLGVVALGHLETDGDAVELRRGHRGELQVADHRVGRHPRID